jgi:hypothetical protein
MTRKSEDKYLNANAYVAKLERDLAANRIATSQALSELGAAAKHCQVRAKTTQRDAKILLRRGGLYSEANAIYIAKARELCRATRNFGAWCLEHGFGRSTGAQLAKIGSATDPAKALQEFRNYNRDKSYITVERKTGRRPTPRVIGDPLANIKIYWNRLSLNEQQAFLAWVLTANQQKLAA